MGLDISHGTWSGGYDAYHRWRKKIAELAGFPPLELMEGFYHPTRNPFTFLTEIPAQGKESQLEMIRHITSQLPIKWSMLKPHPLIDLLNHSDCEGYISYGKCRKIADELETLIPLLPEEDDWGHIGNWKQTTQDFVDGLRLAYQKKQRLLFR